MSTTNTAERANQPGHGRETTAFSHTGTLIDSTTTNSPVQSHFTVTSPREDPGSVNNSTPLWKEHPVDSTKAAIPPVIPPEHSHRTLICCFDGTGDQFDADNSNIVELVSMLKKDDRSKQLVYYQAGIGTYTSPQIATPFMSKIRKTLDEMFAWNLHAHVMSGYEFLMQNYIAGDKICLFGFSRGAYTARSLAGMLHKVGLLPAGNFQQVPFAYKMYKRADHVGWEMSNEFKKAFSVDVNIEFVGVWDTVDSVGLLPKRLPFTTSNTIVRTFRHAVALDERRAKFKANLWNRPTKDEQKLGVQAPNAAVPNGAAAGPSAGSATPPTIQRSHTMDEPAARKIKFGRGVKNGKNGTAHKDPLKDHNHSRNATLGFAKESEDEKVLNRLERMYSEKEEQRTDIEEVWFAASIKSPTVLAVDMLICSILSSYVGGGSVSNKTRHSLARIPLRWMIRECFKANTGIMFVTERLSHVGLDPSTLYPYVQPRPPPLPLDDGKGERAMIRNPPVKEIPIKPHAYLSKKKFHPEQISHHLIEPPRVPFLGSEEAEELHDALSPKYDQLRYKKSWWVLEILPLQLRYQRGDDEWVSYVGSNMGQPRFIPKQRTNGFKVHRSVQLRMEAEFEDERRRAKGKKYVPKPHFKVEPTWVD